MTLAATARVLGPPAGVVDVWCVRLDAPGLPHDVLVQTLDGHEREHAARLRVGGREWATSRGARRAILASYLDMPAGALRFAAGLAGKPRLIDVPGLEFSFARTDGLAVVAVASGRELGVDVERENERTDVDLVAQEFLAPAEAAALAHTPAGRRRSAFFSAWVRHEARLKLHGQGLAGAVPEEVQSSIRTLRLPPGFRGAVATAAGEGTWTVRHREFQPV